MSIQLNYTTSGHRMNKEYKHFITNFAIRSNTEIISEIIGCILT